MALTCGLIGLPLVGKTTLFNLLTRSRRRDIQLRRAHQDQRSHRRHPGCPPGFPGALYHPRKYTPAALEVIDVPGLTHGAGAAFLAAVREVDALIHVVRAFRSDAVPHVEERLNPARDLENVDAELLLADLAGGGNPAGADRRRQEDQGGDPG